MIAYVGQTRATALLAELEALGLGECVTRGEIPPRRLPWFYDCGAFGDWQVKRPFDAVRYTRDLWRIAYWPMAKPAFIVLPDAVAGGVASLALSLSWLEESARAGAPLYLAVQDGMTSADVAAALRPEIAGLFVGGTLSWKLATAGTWVAFAHARQLQVHVGRVGTPGRVHAMRALGVDSIDSCLPLWTRGKLAAFVEALHGRRQPTLLDAEAAW